jgi:hypothetical protein
MDKIITSITFKRDSSLKDMLVRLTDIRSLTSFLFSKRGEGLTITIEETISIENKRRMYNYLNGVLIPFVIKVKREQGEVLDKVECMIAMKMMFAKDIIADNDGSDVFVLLSQRDMTKGRLIDFINDIASHIEMEYGVAVPDADEYKLMKLNFLNKREFKKV